MMGHNIIFILFLSVLPVLVFLCIMLACWHIDTIHTPPIMTEVEVEPTIPKRRSRTQDILRSEYELSKYQKPIVKHQEGTEVEELTID